MDEAGTWKLAPAYDLTFSGGPNGEPSCTVLGEGKNPNIQHLKKLGLEAKLSIEFVDGVIEQTRQAIGKWQSLASEFELAKSNLKLIEAVLNKILYLEAVDPILPAPPINTRFRYTWLIR